MIVINEKIMEEMGNKILGTDASMVDKNIVRVAGLIAMMSIYHQNMKKIKVNSCLYEWDKSGVNGRVITVKYLDKNGVIVDSFEVTKDDISNPNEWLKKYEN